jgi:putative transposase
MGTKELCRKYGMSDATLYGWRLKYGGRNFSDARKLKQLIYTSAQQVEERRRQAG